MRKIKKKKFSSFKKQQMLFENWRGYCVDNGIQQEDGYILMFEGIDRSNPRKQNFDLLMEDVNSGKISHAHFLNLWERSFNYEIEGLINEGLMDSLETLKDKAKDKIATVAENLIKKVVPILMNLLGTALKYISSFLNKLKSYLAKAQKSKKMKEGVMEVEPIRAAMAKLYVTAQHYITKLMVKGMKLGQKLMPYLGPVFKVMCAVAILIVVFGGYSASAATGTEVDVEVMKAALNGANECFQNLGGYEALDAEYVEKIATMSKDVAADDSFKSTSTAFTQAMEIINSDKPINLCADAAQELALAIENDTPLGPMGPKIEATVDSLLRQAQALQSTDPEAFGSAVETGEQLEVLSNIAIESATELSTDIARTSTNDPEAINNYMSNMDKDFQTWARTVSKKYPHVKGTPLPGAEGLEFPTSAVQHALEQDPDLLSKGNELDLKKAILDAAKELGREAGNVITKKKYSSEVVPR